MFFLLRHYRQRLWPSPCSPQGEIPLATTPEIEAQILRYYHAERWRVGTIATQLQLHRDTVARVLCQAGLPLMGPVRRASARRRVNQRDWPGAAQELRRWVYGGGRVLPGLTISCPAAVRTMRGWWL